MGSPAWLTRFSPADRLRLLAFDAELRWLPRPFLDALWAGVDALESAGRPALQERLSAAQSGPSGPARKA